MGYIPFCINNDTNYNKTKPTYSFNCTILSVIGLVV